MNAAEKNLWEKIARFRLDNPHAGFKLSDRLARENGWPKPYALRVCQEYKRFAFLICVATEPLTPSDQVDQAWHLHLLYTENYWADWCANTLGRQIHHGPTKGGDQQKVHFRQCYENTKALYRQYFEQTPPPDIWPSADIRFSEIIFQRVNLHRHWIVPKPNLKRLWNLLKTSPR